MPTASRVCSRWPAVPRSEPWPPAAPSQRSTAGRRRGSRSSAELLEEHGAASLGGDAAPLRLSRLAAVRAVPGRDLRHRALVALLAPRHQVAGRPHDAAADLPVTGPRARRRDPEVQVADIVGVTGVADVADQLPSRHPDAGLDAGLHLAQVRAVVAHAVVT